MSPALIRVRVNGDGSKSFQVVYRRGGRNFSPQSAGSFRGWPGGKTPTGTLAASVTQAEREARQRRDMVAGWLAQGLDPKAELAKLDVAAAPRRAASDVRDAFLASRLDLSPSSLRTYRFGVSAFLDHVGHDRDLATVTVTECIDAVTRLSTEPRGWKKTGLSAKTLGTYWTAVELMFDYAGVDPNPARDRRVKLPRRVHEVAVVPTDVHVLAIVERLPQRLVLPFVFLEQTAVRVETVDEAAWGNMDIAGRRLRVFEKGRGAKKVRFVPVPAWLCDVLADRCPPEDRAEDRRLFPGVTSKQLRTAMGSACKQAGVPHYHPHDLRHRRASLWHLEGIPDAVLADRVGHERASFTKDVYAHVMPTAEVPQATWERVLVKTW